MIIVKFQIQKTKTTKSIVSTDFWPYISGCVKYLYLNWLPKANTLFKCPFQERPFFNDSLPTKNQHVQKNHGEKNIGKHLG